MKIGNVGNNIDLGESDAEVMEGTIDPKGWGLIFNNLLNYSRPIDSLVREIASNCFDSHQEARLLPDFTFEEFVESAYRPTNWTYKGDQEDGFSNDEKRWEENQPEDLRYRLTEEYRRVTALFRNWKEKPVEVEMQRTNRLTGNQQAVIFRDHGVGLSPFRVWKIYRCLTASTKRFTNDQLGGFGQGSKSPLGYQNQFLLVTRYDGWEYNYVVRKAQRGLELDFHGKQQTNKSNGTQVVVAIKEGDWYKFESAIKEQLAYFPEIDFIGCNVDEGIVYRGDSFVYRTTSPFEKMHLCIEGVYYPLDYSAVGLSTYRHYDSSIGQYVDPHTSPIGLRFSLDEIGHAIMEKRENIQYTDDVIEMIKSRIEDVKEELQEIHDEQFGSLSTMEEYLDAFMLSEKGKALKIAEGVSLPNASQFIDIKPKYPKYEGLEKLPKDPFFHWRLHRKVKDGSNNYINQSERRRNLLNWFRDIEKSEEEATYSSPKLNLDVYIAPEEHMESKKNGFICWDTGKDFITIERQDITPSTRRGIFGHGNKGDKDALELAFMKEVSDYLLEKYPKYDDVEISQRYKEILEEQRKRNEQTKIIEKKRKAQRITIRNLYVTEHWSPDEALNFKMDKWNIGQIEGYTGMVIYGHQDDADLVGQLAPIFFQNERFLRKNHWRGAGLDSKKVYLAKIAKSNAKHFKSNPNAMHVDTFIKSKSRVIVRFVTAHKIKALFDEELRGHEHLTEQLSIDATDPIPPNVREAARSLQKYVNTYASMSYFGHRRSSMTDRLIASCLDLFKEQDLFDPFIEDDIRTVESFLAKYPLLRDISLQYIVSLDEIAHYYMPAKGRVSPWLYHRFLKWKDAKLEQELESIIEDSETGGDGQADGLPVITEVDTCV